MTKALKYIVFAIIIFQGSDAFSQGDKWWSEYHYFGSKSLDKSSVWGSFDYQLKSNRLSNQILNEAIFDGRITKATADQFNSENSSSTTYLSGGVIGDLWYRMKREGSWNFLAGFSANDMVYVDLQTGLAQLYLNGNGPYEDKTLPLGPSKLKYLSTQSIGLGMEYTNQTLIWGFSAQLVKTSRYQELMMNNSSIYTAPNGTRIDAMLDFEYVSSASAQPKTTAWYGTGASINTYFVYQKKPEGTMLSVQLRDVGFSAFQGVRSYSLAKDSLFSGVEVDNILALDDALQTNADLDSIEALLGVNTRHNGKTIALPGRLNIDLVQPLSDQLSLAIGLRQILFLGMPEMRLGLNYRPSKYIAFEPHFSAGGYSRFDYGLTVSSNPADFLQVIVKYDLIESQLNAQNSSSQAFFIGGQLLF